MLLSSVWLLGLPGDWLLDDYSLLGMEFPSLLRPRPLSYFTFWLNFEWSGAVPWAFRLTNIMLHAVAAQFCYRALRRLLGDERAFFAAAMFAVNPLQADAVLYVFSRPVVLMGLLLWVALDRWLAGKHWWAVLFYSLALLAKEEAIAFPLFLVALHFSISKNAKEWRPIGVMLGLAIVALGGVIYATRSLAGSGAGVQAGVGWLSYLATQPVVIGRYLKQLVWPSFTGMRWMVDVAPEWCLVLWFMPVVGLYLARRHYKRAGWAFWLVGALLFLSPTSSVFPIADLAASRRMYLPLAMLAAAVPAFRWQLVLVLVYAGLSGHWAYSIYREPKVLWRMTMERQPTNVGALLQYTKYVAPEEALHALMSAPALQDAGYQTELGRVYLELRKPADALGAFGKALAIEPGVASHVYNRGVALAALGQREAAEMDFKRALEIDPSHKSAREAMGLR